MNSSEELLFRTRRLIAQVRAALTDMPSLREIDQWTAESNSRIQVFRDGITQFNNTGNVRTALYFVHSRLTR
jgi:NAD-specific glutamate dehydrogenase